MGELAVPGSGDQELSAAGLDYLAGGGFTTGIRLRLTGRPLVRCVRPLLPFGRPDSAG